MSDDSTLNIEHLVRLARLSLTPAEQAAVNDDLQNIITMIDQMQRVPTDNVTPMAHPFDASQRLRADVVTESDQRAELQGSAPATEAGYYLVPRVVE